MLYFEVYCVNLPLGRRLSQTSSDGAFTSIGCAPHSLRSLFACSKRRARGPVNAAPAWHARVRAVVSGVRLMEDLNQTPDLVPVETPNSPRDCASSGYRETWLRGGKRFKKKREGGGGRKFFAESLCKLSLSRRGYCKLQQHGLREAGRQTIAMRHRASIQLQ